MVPGVEPIPMFEVATTVAMFQVPATFTLVVKMFEAVSAFDMKALPRTYRLVSAGTAPIPILEVATRDKRFVVPVTFKLIPNIDAPLSSVTLVVERFEVPETFMFVAKRLVAFMIAALPLV